MNVIPKKISVSFREDDYDPDEQRGIVTPQTERDMRLLFLLLELLSTSDKQ